MAINILSLSALFVLLMLQWQKKTPVEVQEHLSHLSSLLNDRISALTNYPDRLPAVHYKTRLPANARYEKDTIWIGEIQRDYRTRGDTLSIIYHEYIHYLLEAEAKYPLSYEAGGQIVQWDTDESYTYYPTQQEVEQLLKEYEKSEWLSRESLSATQKQQQIDRLRKDLSQARELPFIYAPSNLALEEIEAYEAQLDGEKIGLYILSQAARAAIHRRLRQMCDTYLRRLAYERKMGINMDGSKQ